MCRNWDLTQPNNFKTFKKKEKCLHAHFSSTYNKIATTQRLAWPLGKDNMQIWEAFHMLCPSPLSWNPLLIHRYKHTHTHARARGFSYMALGYSMTSCIDFEERSGWWTVLAFQARPSHPTDFEDDSSEDASTLPKLRLKQMNLVAYCGESWTPCPALPSHFTYVCPPRLLAWTWSFLHTHTHRATHTSRGK